MCTSFTKKHATAVSWRKMGLLIWYRTSEFSHRKENRWFFPYILHKNQLSGILHLNVWAITILPENNNGEYFYELTIGTDFLNITHTHTALIVKAKFGKTTLKLRASVQNRLLREWKVKTNWENVFATRQVLFRYTEHLHTNQYENAITTQ